MCVVCVSGCAKGWSTEEQQRFLEDCQDNQGAENICECILECLESNYKNYSLVLDNLDIFLAVLFELYLIVNLIQRKEWILFVLHFHMQHHMHLL